MKKQLILACALAGLSTHAKPDNMGFYTGAGLGGNYFNAISSFENAKNDALGWSSQVFTGYRHNFKGHVVFGAEIEAKYNHVKAYSSKNLYAGKPTWYVSVSPLIGYRWNNVMPYFKAGYTLSEHKLSLSDPIFNFSNGKPSHGFNVGGGVEYFINSKFSVRLDFSHYTFESKQYFLNRKHTMTNSISSASLIYNF